MKATEQIIAGYVSLQDREAFKTLKRQHQQLLDDVRIHGVSWFQTIGRERYPRQGD
ncbi:hypothetical protein [Bradyrhizobium embrapense]